MKPKSLLSFILIVSVAGLLSFQNQSNTQETITLVDAINAGKISVQTKSTGGYSGPCVAMTITNKSRQPLRIKIPAGTQYLPEDEGEQTLIQLEDNNVLVNSSNSKTIHVDAYCMEASDRCPSSSGNMILGSNQNKNLNNLITYLKGKTIDPTAYQDAVWAISDGHSISNIIADDEQTKGLRKYVASLTGQKDSWYTSPQSVHVDNNGNFNYTTVTINGELAFDCSKGKPIFQELKKENGEVMFTSEKMFTPVTNHVRYEFKLSVKGWEKGNYYVDINDGEKQLAKFVFKV